MHNLFQDDLKDWAKEAAMIRLIYAHAQCNIAATAATDSTVDLPFERTALSVGPYWLEHVLNGTASIFLVLPPDHWLDDVESGPMIGGHGCFKSGTFLQDLCTSRVHKYFGNVLKRKRAKFLYLPSFHYLNNGSGKIKNTLDII